MVEAEVRITLRLPEELRDKLLASAENASRSMNGEIVERLDWSFERATQEISSLQEELAKAMKRADSLRESERRLMTTVRDLSQHQAALERRVTELQERLAEAERNNRQEADFLKEQEQLDRAIAAFEEERFGLMAQAAASGARADAFLDVIRHLTNIIGEASGNDPETMKMLAQSIRDLDKDGKGESD